MNFTTYPLLTNLSSIYTTEVHQGDCIFIPSGTWYTVRSQGPTTIAVRFVVKNFDSVEEVQGCDGERVSVPLDQVSCCYFCFLSFNSKSFGFFSAGNSFVATPGG